MTKIIHIFSQFNLTFVANEEFIHIFASITFGTANDLKGDCNGKLEVKPTSHSR